MKLPADQKRIEGTALRRNMAVYGLRVISEEERRISLSFSSEEPYDRWFGREILSHDEGAADFGRLTEVGALLFHHGMDPNLGHIPVGRIEEVTLDGDKHRGTAEVTFDEDENSNLIYQKCKSGSIRGVSVGYRIDAYEEVKSGKTSANGRFTGPCVVATKWSPYEISIEPTPADPTVGVGRSVESTLCKGEFTMDEEEDTVPMTPTAERSAVPATPPPVVPAAPSLDQVRSQAVTEERARVGEITALCLEFQMDPTEHIKEGRSVDEVRAIALDVLKKAAQKPIPAPNAEVVADEEDKFRAAARDGMLIRMGITPEKPADGARDFRGMTLRSLAAKCVTRSGLELDVFQADDEDLLRSALGFDQTRGVYQPDSAFVSIVNNTIGSSMSKGYQTANTTYQLWVGRGSNPNFKAAKRFRLSAAGEMIEIPQGGEFKADAVTDEGVDTKLKTYGKKFGFTRQAFVDDDLGTLAKAIMAQSRSVRRTINKQVYKILGTNQKYVLDGKALFHADHGNLGTPAALSKDSLGDLYVKMSLQKDLSGREQLNILPKYGLFPATIQMDARQLLHSMSDPEANHSGVVNPVQGLITPIFEAELDRYSKTGFFIIADAMDVDTIEVGYLNGKEEPTLESRVSWDTLGIDYRMFLDWYVALLDFRGLAMNAGK